MEASPIQGIDKRVNPITCIVSKMIRATETVSLGDSGSHGILIEN